MSTTPLFNFPEIDKKRTRKNAHAILSKYRMLERIAEEGFVQKVTANYSFEVKSFTGNVSNQVENGVVRKITAEQELVKITKAVNKLGLQDRKMIYDRYLSRIELTNGVISMNYNMSERTFYRELDKVLIRFAEAYENGSILAEKWQ